MLRRRGAAAGVSLVLAAAMAGCGSSEGSSPSTSAGNEIPVGVIGSYSQGAFPSLNASAREASKAWASAVNAAGGINGRRVHLYVEDDKGDAATGAAAAKTLIDKDHVVAIVGHISQNSASWAAYAAARKVPVVGGNTYDLANLKYPNFFNVGGNIVSTFYGVTTLAKARGPKMGNLYCAEVPGCAATNAMLNGFGRSLGGLKVAYSSKVAATAPDYTAACQGLKSAGVTSYSLATSGQVMKNISGRCVQQGFKAPLIIPDVADSTFAADPAFEGTEIVSTIVPYFDKSLPDMKAFHDALAKYAPAIGTAKTPLTNPIEQTWVSGKLFEAAVKAIGDKPITRDSVEQGLYSLKGDTLGGLTAPLTFTPGKVSLHNCYFYYAIHGGEFVAPKGLKPICAPDAAIGAVVSKLGG